MDARSLAARSVALASLLCEVERGESGEEERERAKEGNELGFQAPARRQGFYPSEMHARPSDLDGRRRFTEPAFSPGGCARQAEFPAQAKVAAWGRVSAREGRTRLWALGRFRPKQ